LEQASIRKKCGIVFKRAVPAEAEKEETE